MPVMKPTDVIALLIGALALTSLLKGSPEAGAADYTPQLFAAASADAPEIVHEINELRALCDEQRDITLKILREIVAVGSLAGEDLNTTIDRLNYNKHDMLAAIREYSKTPSARRNKDLSEQIQTRIGDRSCPEMSHIEKQRLFPEALKYNPAMIRIGKRYFPEVFGTPALVNSSITTLAFPRAIG